MLSRSFSILVGVVALSACGGNSSESSPSSSLGVQLTADDPFDGRTLPLDSFLVLSSDSKKTLDAAVDELTSKCMEDRGYEYIPYPFSPPRQILDLRLRYGYIDAEEARKSGYQGVMSAAKDSEHERLVSDVDEYRREFGPAYEDALYGGGVSASSACYPSSQEEIYGAVGGLFNLAEYQAMVELQTESADLLYASRDARAVIDRWSSCMAAAGYSFAEWWQARETFSQVQEISDAERQQAGSDAQCRTRVRLEASLLDVEASIMTKLIEENSSIIDGYQKELSLRVARAQEIIES